MDNIKFSYVEVLDKLKDVTREYKKGGVSVSYRIGYEIDEETDDLSVYVRFQDEGMQEIELPGFKTKGYYSMSVEGLEEDVKILVDNAEKELDLFYEGKQKEYQLDRLKKLYSSYNTVNYR